ncbi:MAG TPA: V-type ATP synthase subunit F [Candidatus Atribacteria bacterium]|nr:V-type ATP synthase subunit F [Candidatus Atribacteria bacterium]
MYKIALIGNRDTIIGFKLLGVSLFPTVKKDETMEILDKLVNEEYAAIFVTEDIACQIFEEIKNLQKTSFASITIIPNKLETKCLGLKTLRKNIEKAIGTDILFRKEVE